VNMYFYRNVQTKSPTLGHSMNTLPFGDNINASLKNALGLLNHGINNVTDKMILNQNNNLPDVRGRYFVGPGGPTPEDYLGMESDIMFKQMASSESPLDPYSTPVLNLGPIGSLGDLQPQPVSLSGSISRVPHDPEELVNGRYMSSRERMTPPESPRELLDRGERLDNNQDNRIQQELQHMEHQQPRELGIKISAQDLSLMQRNIKNESNETEH